MFAFLLQKLGNVIEQAQQRRRDTYLASSADLGDLERRMRAFDVGGRAF
jgi:hypothetical protein